MDISLIRIVFFLFNVQIVCVDAFFQEAPNSPGKGVEGTTETCEETSTISTCITNL